MQIEWQGMVMDVHISCNSSAQTHSTLSHWTTLTKHIFKGKIIKNIKTATAEHLNKREPLWSAKPYMTAQITCMKLALDLILSISNPTLHSQTFFLKKQTKVYVCLQRMCVVTSEWGGSKLYSDLAIYIKNHKRKPQSHFGKKEKGLR